MPQRAATIESLPAAFAMVKAMQAQGLDWGEGYRPLVRQALAEIIETEMSAAVDRRLESLEAEDDADRRNGYYRRSLLTNSATSSFSLRAPAATARPKWRAPTPGASPSAGAKPTPPQSLACATISTSFSPASATRRPPSEGRCGQPTPSNAGSQRSAAEPGPWAYFRTQPQSTVFSSLSSPMKTKSRESQPFSPRHITCDVTHGRNSSRSRCVWGVRRCDGFPSPPLGGGGWRFRSARQRGRRGGSILSEVQIALHGLPGQQPGRTGGRPGGLSHHGRASGNHRSRNSRHPRGRSSGGHS